MDGELINTAYTYNQGRVVINTMFSGVAQFNGFATNLVTTGSSYYIQDNDYTIIQTGGDNVTVPDAGALRGRTFIIKNYSLGDFNVIPDGGTIDSVASGLTLASMQCVTLQSIGIGGSDWYVLNLYIP